MRNKFIYPLAMTLFLCLGVSAQTFTFSYQGELKDGAAPADGVYDFRFRLTDLLGNQVGNPVNINNVAVTDGIFTVTLNFGQEAFAGGAIRNLEISVKQDAETEYTTLAPAQRIVSVPYAIRAINSGQADSATNADNAQNAVNATNAQNANTANFASNAGTLDGIDSTGFARISNGTVSADVINANNQYNFAGQRFIWTVNEFNDRNLFIGLEGPNPANITDENNTFIGNRAGFSLTEGSSNTVVGSEAGEDLDIGISNSFFGSSAGREVTFGSRNSFFGNAAGRVQVSGQGNSYFGSFAGINTETGFFNTFIGSDAGVTNETGSNNTTLGENADVGSADLEFATAIGSRSRVFTSNTIALGRTDGSDKVVIYGVGSGGSAQLCRNGSNQISFCSSSLRYKKNIRPFNSGLNLIRKLKPITFDWKDTGRTDLGLGAEDVAAIEPLLVTFNEKGEVEGVKYDRLGVVLLNAVGEQQTQIEAQQKENERLRQKIETQEKRIETQRKRLDEQERMIEGLRQIVCARNAGAEICSNNTGETENEN